MKNLLGILIGVTCLVPLARAETECTSPGSVVRDFVKSGGTVIAEGAFFGDKLVFYPASGGSEEWARDSSDGRFKPASGPRSLCIHDDPDGGPDTWEFYDGVAPTPTAEGTLEPQ